MGGQSDPGNAAAGLPFWLLLLLVAQRRGIACARTCGKALGEVRGIALAALP